MFVDVLANVGFGPACSLEMFSQLGRHDDRVVAWPDRIVRHVGPDFGDERVQDFLGHGSPLVHDLARCHCCHGSNRRDMGIPETFGGQGQPW